MQGAWDRSLVRELKILNAEWCSQKVKIEKAEIQKD